jgi:hypothetical protein
MGVQGMQMSESQPHLQVVHPVNTDEEMVTENWQNNQINYFSKQGNVLAYAIQKLHG